LLDLKRDKQKKASLMVCCLANRELKSEMAKLRGDCSFALAHTRK